MKNPSIHPIAEFHGSPRACGKNYGISQAEAIRAWLNMETAPDPRRLRYASRCWEKLGNWQRPVVEFVRGMAEGSGLSMEETTLLLLHEEIVHTKPCTAIGATGPATRDGSAIIGQNWDWNSDKYPWPSLLRLRTDAMPATFTYAYPGLWASAGINEYGLSLVWTGAGYLPKVRPIVGVPTYALIAGILACRTCREAISLMRRTLNAGSFIFFLADAGGEVWVLEGVPGHFEAVQCRDVITRANHYECAAICHKAKQAVPTSTRKANTRNRANRIAALTKKYRGRIDRKVVESILCDHFPRFGLSICQHPMPGRLGLTIDSFYAVPSKREFWIARGHPCRHQYQRYRVTS